MGFSLSSQVLLISVAVLYVCLNEFGYAVDTQKIGQKVQKRIYVLGLLTVIGFIGFIFGIGLVGAGK